MAMKCKPLYQKKISHKYESNSPWKLKPPMNWNWPKYKSIQIIELIEHSPPAFASIFRTSFGFRKIKSVELQITVRIMFIIWPLKPSCYSRYQLKHMTVSGFLYAVAISVYQYIMHEFPLRIYAAVINKWTMYFLRFEVFQTMKLDKKVLWVVVRVYYIVLRSKCTILCFVEQICIFINLCQHLRSIHYGGIVINIF